MYMTIVLAYATGSQAIKHHLMERTGMSKDVTAEDICCLLASLFMSLVRDTLIV